MRFAFLDVTGFRPIDSWIVEDDEDLLPELLEISVGGLELGQEVSIGRFDRLDMRDGYSDQLRSLSCPGRVEKALTSVEETGLGRPLRGLREDFLQSPKALSELVSPSLTLVSALYMTVSGRVFYYVGTD